MYLMQSKVVVEQRDPNLCAPYWVENFKETRNSSIPRQMICVPFNTILAAMDGSMLAKVDCFGHIAPSVFLEGRVNDPQLVQPWRLVTEDGCTKRFANNSTLLHLFCRYDITYAHSATLLCNQYPHIYSDRMTTIFQPRLW